MSAPATATDVALYLVKLARELDSLVEAINGAEKEAVQKRAAFDLAYSRAFVAQTAPWTSGGTWR